MDDVQRWQVPGRVNLIGEHLDYCGGTVLPIAIDRGLLIKARRREDSVVQLWSRGERIVVDPGDLNPGDRSGWAAHAAGAVWALGRSGVTVPGADVVIESTLPDGAGLSSSAALTCGIALALADLAGSDPSRLDLARIGQHAESEYVGVPVGLMDQIAVLCADDGQALHIDFAADDPALVPVPAAWASAGLSLVVIDTRVKHALADGEYGARRDECRTAADELGLEHLAQVGLDQLLRLRDETLKARARHVLTESARVRGAVNALRQGAWVQFGAMLTASHASLRDDFEVSCAELDLAVEAALACEALGARMTGGGFGGSAIALLPSTAVNRLRTTVESRFETAGWTGPDVFEVTPSPGAHRIL